MLTLPAAPCCSVDVDTMQQQIVQGAMVLGSVPDCFRKSPKTQKNHVIHNTNLEAVA